MKPPYISRGCFGCGTENPRSLGLKPRLEGDELVAELTVPADYRGFSRVAHGGISATLLDELMGMCVGSHLEGRMVTLRIEIDFIRPVFVETPIRVEARYAGVEDRYHIGEGRIFDADGKELARARGRFMPIDASQAQRFMGREFGDGKSDV